MRRLLAPALAILALAGAAFQEEAAPKDPVVEAVIREGRKNPQVMAHLDHLVNKIGPRLTSSDRLTQAQEWAKGRFAEWGLKNCRLEEWGTFPVGFNRGPWSGKMTAPEELDLTFITRSWSPGTKGPVEGPAVLGPKTPEELEKVRPRLKGAWILTSGAPASKDFNDQFLAACDEAGAAGLVRAGSGELILTDGNHRISWESLPKRVNITLLRAHFDKVAGHLREGKDVRLTFDIRNEFKKGPIPLYNVIAEIPGTEKPDEMVIVGGHIDSWDGATGTTDNGTGVVTTLEAARLLMAAGAKPRRTIRFMLWSGEEQGLLGSLGHIRKFPKECDKVSAVLVHDGGTNYVSGIQATEKMIPHFEKAFAPLMGLNPEFKFEIRTVKSLPYGIGSDHDSYLGKGVPGFFWMQAGRANYTRTHHTQFDTFEAGIKEYEEHTSIVVALGALGVANLDGMIPRDGMLNAQADGGRRRLGIDLDDDGVTVTEVIPEYPGQRAGLKVGDRLVSLDGKAIKSRDGLIEIMQKCPAKTKLRVKRGDKELDLDVSFER